MLVSICALVFSFFRYAYKHIKPSNFEIYFLNHDFEYILTSIHVLIFLPLVPAGELDFAAGLVRSCLPPLSLPPSPHVAGRCPPFFRPSGVAEAESFWGEAWSPNSFL
jgi:hypothetical protein